ncbi:hypothetical protein HNP29_005962, partial [Pseudomonas alcaligenes]|nr:hypothetical protein [Pseudomonas alcaligenes]
MHLCHARLRLVEVKSDLHPCISTNYPFRGNSSRLIIGGGAG